MIVLYTDFGVNGPYVGQMRAVLYQHAPQVPVIELFSNAPSYNPIAAAYLLAAYVTEFPKNTIFLCVVDPGVGSASRKPIIYKIDDRWYVGPDNGLFDVVIHRAKHPDKTACWEITWQPVKLSTTFHGRDLFAPVAAMLANNESPPGIRCTHIDSKISNIGNDLHQIIYFDSFGNAMTGVQATSVNASSIIRIKDYLFSRARTFSAVALGEGFWFENANNLVEIAVNQGNARETYNLQIGTTIDIVQNRV